MKFDKVPVQLQSKFNGFATVRLKDKSTRNEGPFITFLQRWLAGGREPRGRVLHTRLPLADRVLRRRAAQLLGALEDLVLGARNLSR